MQTLFKTKAGKALVGTVAAGAMAITAATPALARDSGGINAGTVVAGALVVGGLAAILSSGNGRDDYAYGARSGRYERYGRGGVNSRSAVEQCVAVATRSANRYSYGGRAHVTDIRDVERKDYGYKVKGRIAVNSMTRGWRSGDGEYGRGWGGDYRGWNKSLRGYDSGKFECKIEYSGRLRGLEFSGIRGL